MPKSASDEDISSPRDSSWFTALSPDARAALESVAEFSHCMLAFLDTTRTLSQQLIDIAIMSYVACALYDCNGGKFILAVSCHDIHVNFARALARVAYAIHAANKARCPVPVLLFLMGDDPVESCFGGPAQLHTIAPVTCSSSGTAFRMPSR